MPYYVVACCVDCGSATTVERKTEPRGTHVRVNCDGQMVYNGGTLDEYCPSHKGRVESID